MPNSAIRSFESHCVHAALIPEAGIPRVGSVLGSLSSWHFTPVADHDESRYFQRFFGIRWATQAASEVVAGRKIN